MELSQNKIHPIIDWEENLNNLAVKLFVKDIFNTKQKFSVKI